MNNRKDWKAWVRKIIYIPGWLLILLTVLCTVGLITVFVMKWDQSPIAYIVYVLSAYMLTTVCFFFIKVVPGRYRRLKEKFLAHPYGNKYATDIGYKVRCSLYISLGINVIYSIFKLASGILYSSFWWGAIAIYYILLSVIRFIILKYMRNDTGNQNKRLEFQRYRLCAILMLLLNSTLSGIVLHMLVKNEAYTYPEVIIITSATYTFYTVTVSIIDIVKYRKYESPIMSASKAIRFAAALVSLLSLETSMLTKYGTDESFRRIMTSLTGAGVCIIVLGMSLYMIVRATKEIKKLRELEGEIYGRTE